MERVRIADMNTSPYSGGVRCLYQALNNKTVCESSPSNTPVDLLQTLPDIAEAETPLTADPPAMSDNNKTMAKPSAKSGTEAPHRSSVHIYNPHHYETRPQTVEENMYLCHKHACEMENQTNGGTLYSAKYGYQSPLSYGKIQQKPVRKDSNTYADTLYSNKYHKNKHKSKDELRFSTHSLPAVTYNTKETNQKHFLSRSGLLFRKNVKNNSQLDDFYDEVGVSETSCLPSLKKIMIVACILVGLVLALGGIAIGVLVYPKEKSHQSGRCPEEQVHCGSENGCVSYSSVCSLASLQHCPSYVLTLCSHTYQAINSTVVKPSTAYQHDETQIFIEINYDEHGWAHYINSSNRESKYKVLDKVTTYSSAQQMCMNLGGHLAHITSMREQLFLEHFLRVQTEAKSDPDSEFQVPRGYWIGARRARGSHSGTCMTSQWRWLDAHGRPLSDVTSFQAFAMGKPDNYFKPEECLYMSTSDINGENSFLKWDDIACDMPGLAELRPLCEVNLRSQTNT